MTRASLTNSQSCNRREFIKITALALPAIAVGCRSVTGSSSGGSDFVVVRNRRFERHGRPYRFIGANFYQAAMLGDPGLPGGRERLARELDMLRLAGVTNLRVLAGSEGSIDAGDGRRGIVQQPGQWDEGLMRGLDFTLAEMAKRDMTGVLYLTNYWDWSGGMAMYVHWATGEPIPDPHRPGNKHVGADHMNYAARFYGMPHAQELFRLHVTYLLKRRNTINGRRYFDDPTIMSWQLANEPRPGTDDPASKRVLPAFHKWIDETARFIKDRAPRQLVSTGNEGTVGCLGDSDAFLGAHQSKFVDYATLHLWVKNWGWLKEPRLGPQYESVVQRALRHIQFHADLSRQLGKPLVMEEFGIGRDEDCTRWGSPTLMRDDYYKRLFACVLDSSRAGDPLQATNFWVWSGEGSLNAHCNRASSEGNCEEPVDANGVLHNDRSTLDVIRRFNTELAGLTS